MLRVLDSSMNLLAVFDKVLICKTRTVLNAEYLLDFTITVDKSKSQYLYHSSNTLVVDDDYFKVYKLKEVHKTGQTVTLSVQAEHIHYKLIDTTLTDFNMTDTIFNIGAEILRGTGFSFGTDFTEVVQVKVDGEATRKAVLLALANKCTGEIEYTTHNIRMMRDIGKNRLHAKFGNNINEISREMDFSNNTSNYTVNLIDTTNPNLKELKTAHLGDIVVVTDTELGINAVEKKVIEVEKDHVLGIHTKVTLGDPLPKVIEAIKKNIKVGNVITEVIHQQVINVETAHILNAWIKNLFVQYLETNFDALVPRNPTTERLYVRVINNEFSFIEAKLSPTEVEPLLIADPNGNGGKVNVYYTAIGNHPDAYRYFTITNPKQVHKDLTDAEAEAFRVLVKKTLTENVKMKISFKEVELSNGSRTVTPVMTLGIGSDPTGGTSRGISEIFKDILGVCLKQNLDINDTWCGFRLNSTTGAAEYRNPITGQWIDLSNITVGGTGNNVYWLDKTIFDVSMFQNANCNHYGIDTRSTDKVIGQYSTFYGASAITFLGVEEQTALPPIQPTSKYLYKNGNEFVDITGGWNILLNAGNVVKSAQYMDAKIHNSSDRGMQTVFGCTNGIDFTSYSKMYYTIERVTSPDGSNSATPRITSNLEYGHWTPWATNITHDMLNNKTTFEADITTINGLFYLSFIGEWGAATGYNTLRVHEVWLE